MAGGWSSTCHDSVYFAPINVNGSLGTWQVTKSMPGARVGHETHERNGYLYVLGGSDANGIMHNDVWYSKINADGTVGTWISTTSFNIARSVTDYTIYANQIYLTGGYANGSMYLNDVQFATFVD